MSTATTHSDIKHGDTSATDIQLTWKKPIDTSGINWSQFDAELDQPFELTTAQIDSFGSQGFVKLKDVFSPELIQSFGDEITNQVIRLNTNNTPLEQRTTYGKAFLQIMNLWTQSEIVKRFVFSKRLAKIASELMGVRGVRLYHDQALYKEPAGGITPWHADQYYWPLSSNNTVTAWIPLQAVPMELGPLAFSATSHRFKIGRDLEIGDDSEIKLSKTLLESGLPFVEEPFDMGEVSFPLWVDLPPRGCEPKRSPAQGDDDYLFGGWQHGHSAEIQGARERSSRLDARDEAGGCGAITIESSVVAGVIKR